MPSKHQREHQEMIGLADDILASVTARPGELARLRLAFARLVNRHCDEEGAMVRNAVARGQLARSVVVPFERDLLRWRTDLALCNSEWPAARVTSDPQGYAHRFGALAAALRDYIAREDRDILAAIANARPGALRAA